MDLHIKNATIIAPGNLHHGKVRSVLIREGYIQKIGETPFEGEDAPLLEAKGLHLSIGWMDFGVQVGDPGLEQRETLHTAGAAAAAGGFTAVVALPNTDPVIDTKSGVQYICKNAEGKLVNFYPMGALTLKCAGREITEMIDMQRAGAVAFTDGPVALQHTGVMLRALNYVKAFGGVVAHQPLDDHLCHGGQVHEGIVSTSLGMPGIPAIAEEVMVRRDLHLLEYTESRLHLANISTAGAVQMVREAKAKGLQVTASVAVMNLIYEDEATTTFDSNYKVLPPLRSAADREALQEGVLDGTIDIISSNHQPLEEEAKKLEFPYAEFGATGLETLYALCRTHLRDWLTDEVLVEKIAYAPRRILGLDLPEIKEGEMAELTLFQPDAQWVYDRSRVYSRSLNSPVLGQELRGRAVAVVNNNQSFVNAHS
ncbi:MAG: dihydroorotase [Phaeodactylibacter sp.]|uniref:dihydroorotase n=1 Tax=Phaeodactylibacter sp. TaxID=1940289 RepID=UPI0032EEDDBE